MLPGLFDGTVAPPTEGVNFAFGGSLSSDVNVGGPPLPGLQQQIETFGVLSAVVPPDPDALFLLLAGGNDYNEAIANPDPTTPLAALPEQVTENLVNAVTALIGQGAQQLLVSNLPDLSLQPFADTLDQINPQSSSLLSGFSQQHNQLLSQKLTALEAASGVEIIQFDLEGLLNSVVESPEAFGFENVTDACLINFQPGFQFDGICENPDEFLFWDNIHPTEAGHSAIAQLTLSTLTAADPENPPAQSVPEPAVVLGLLVGAGAMALSTRYRKVKFS